MTHNTEFLQKPNTGQWLQGKETNNAIKELGRSANYATIATIGYADSVAEEFSSSHPGRHFQISPGPSQVNSNRSIYDTLPDGTKQITPISKLPNILDSYVEVDENNKLFERHGITKRLPSVLHLSINTNTRAMNRYVSWVQFRLNTLVNDGEKFWSLAILIMQRSNIFKSLMLHEVNPHWHRAMTLKEVYLLINKCNLYWETLPVTLKYKRVYIPKTMGEDGEVKKWRPLGVPTVSWRIYLHSLQQFLMIFLKDRISEYQHGFYKGRGTKTA